MSQRVRREVADDFRHEAVRLTQASGRTIKQVPVGSGACESGANLTPANVNFRRGQNILQERERIKRQAGHL